MKPPSSRRRDRAGFTLTEILIAVTIFGLTSVGVVSVLLQGMRMYYNDRAVLGINRDIRTFTQQMDTDAVTSNFFSMYSDFSTRVVGDMVVFVFTDPSSTSQGVSMINRLVGYYREVTNTTLNTGPVHRFDLTVSPAVDATSTTIGALLNTKVTGGVSTYPIVTQLAQGLATATSGATPTPKLFYNFKNRSVMVDAQISESLNEVKTSTSRIGNTYNFTISPRG